jgi:rubrerythrin
MQLSTVYGFKCPKCNTSIDIGIGLELNKENPKCPNCGTGMIPNVNASPVAANVTCKNCNVSFGMIDSDKCPFCGKPF